jgi:hypothetical protein
MKATNQKDNPVYVIMGKRPVVGPLSITGILALAGVLGPLVLIAGDFSAAFTSPHYNLFHDSISSLALTRMGWLQTIGFLAIGLLVEIFVAGLLFNIRPRRGFRPSVALLVFFGFGLLMVGAFRTDPVGAAGTIEGTIHGIASKAVFFIFPVAVLLIAASLRSDPRWKRLSIYTVVAGILGFLLIVAVFLADNTSWFGLFERLLVVNMIVWVEVIAIQLLRLSLGWGPKMEESRPVAESGA